MSQPPGTIPSPPVRPARPQYWWGLVGAFALIAFVGATVVMVRDADTDPLVPDLAATDTSAPTPAEYSLDQKICERLDVFWLDEDFAGPDKELTSNVTVGTSGERDSVTCTGMFGVLDDEDGHGTLTVHIVYHEDTETAADWWRRESALAPEESALKAPEGGWDEIAMAQSTPSGESEVLTRAQFYDGNLYVELEWTWEIEPAVNDELCARATARLATSVWGAIPR